MRRALPLLALLLSALPLASAFAQRDGERQEFLRQINEERRRAGSPPLRASTALDRVAQWHAEEIAKRGSLRLPPGTNEAVNDMLEKVGYEAHGWTEGLATSSGGPADVVADWKRNNPQVFRAMMDPEVRDLGLGLGRLQGMRLYVSLFSQPQSERFSRETSDLGDRAKVRAQVLARVNAERKRAGVAPLRADPLLDKAAQKHAEDMLARSYFAHKSPEGRSVRDRAEAVGYDWRAIGENIAEGQRSVDEVMDTWMDSPGHRRNILDPAFKELGVGLAFGKSRGSYRILWAQAFGTPR